MSGAVLEATRRGTASYGVTLTSQPIAAVLVEVRISGGAWLDMRTCSDNVEQGVCLIFDAENWQQPQTVIMKTEV